MFPADAVCVVVFVAAPAIELVANKEKATARAPAASRLFEEVGSCTDTFLLAGLGFLASVCLVR